MCLRVLLMRHNEQENANKKALLAKQLKIKDIKAKKLIATQLEKDPKKYTGTLVSNALLAKKTYFFKVCLQLAASKLHTAIFVHQRPFSKDLQASLPLSASNSSKRSRKSSFRSL
jgi:phosphohistidine phosphatase SixA